MGRPQVEIRRPPSTAKEWAEAAIRVFAIGAVASAPGEAAAALVLGYPADRNVVLFQTVMTLLDGVGFAIILATVAVLLRDPAWPARRRPVALALAATCGLIIALVSEWTGTRVLRWWSYPPDLPTVLGASLWAVAAWTVTPPILFAAYGAGPRSWCTAALVTVALGLSAAWAFAMR